jgi:hypothetical protein
MLAMNVFKQDAFSAISLTEAVRKTQTIPGLIGAMKLFQPMPIRTRAVAVELNSNQLNIIQTSEAGAPRTRRSNDKATIVDLRVRRIEESSMITAESIQGIREFGSETELVQLQKEVARRQQGIADDLTATKERLYLSCINGTLLDADDSVIYNYYTTFGIAPPTEVGFNWTARTAVKQFVAANVIRPIVRAVGGAAPTGMRIVALCGDDFFDLVQENAEYKARYLNTENASKLVESTVFQSIEAWGVTWINFRGTDDNSKVAIASTKARFFPMGVRGLFQEAFAPAPTFQFVNTLGQEWYSRIVMDKDRDEWSDVEMESYRLPICTRPEALISGRSGA